jgi:hypothetical protein
MALSGSRSLGRGLPFWPTAGPRKLGLGYARVGGTEEARHLCRELGERASRGEYVPPFARLFIDVGVKDLARWAPISTRA